MLTEFAFTPSVFDETAHDDLGAWREQLIRLGARMFPDEDAWPVMVSDLYGGSWHSKALEMAATATDASTRRLCQSLLEMAAKTLVRRPLALSAWPGDDSVAWAMEAINTSKAAPIERIVSCRPTRNALSEDHDCVRCIDEVTDRGFWKGISAGWSQEMKIADQLNSLQKLILHADFLVLIAPRVEGGDNDETEFARRMIQAISRRPEQFGRTDFEIHTNMPHARELPQGMQSEDVRKSVGKICQSLRSALVSNQRVRVVFWPKILDRNLIAGIRTVLSDQSQVQSPRWGVSMPHIAIKSDERNARDPAYWTLLPLKRVGDLHRQFCTSGGVGHSHHEWVTL